MLYREIQPAASLVRFVECFWTLEGGLDGFAAPERILPDGCVELILNFGARFCELRCDGRREPQPLNFLVGQMTQPTLIAPTGSAQLIGIRFHPGGTFPFFRIPMHETTNLVIELGAISRDLERDLLASAETAPSLAMKIRALEKVLTQRVCDCKQDSWLIELAANVVRAGGKLSVDALANDAGISVRQLERRFLREVGVGPKLLSRILRFQQVFSAVDRRDPEWAMVALDCGYYDQAHLIRDFQQFSQQTPAVLFTNTSALTESFTRKNRVSHFYNILT